MKKIIMPLFLVAAMTAATAQYQLPNAGFEQWDGGETSEPTHWNSFATSDGDYASLASSTHHYRRSGHRPGGTGSRYLTIYTKSMLFGAVKANGNMTTGRIHAGSMSASDSENYNYTQRGNGEHSCPFTATPDSMYVWVSYYASSGSSQAQVSAILHGDSDFKAPNEESDASKYAARAVARCTRTTSSATAMQWQWLKVPFVYDGSAAPAYMLVNITTNVTPGGGSANDSLSVDDIELIYSAWLTGISLDGLPLTAFEKGRLDYRVRVADTGALTTTAVEWETEVADARVEMERRRLDDTTMRVELRVTAEDGETEHTYTVTLTTDPAAPSGIDAAAEGSRIGVYPNPTTQRITVEADGEVTIVDLDGRELMRREVHGKEVIDLGGWPDGVYMVRCGNGVRCVVKRG